MTKFSGLTILLLSILLMAFCVNQKPNIRLYDEGYKLTWDDFELPFPDTATHIAEIEVNFNITTRSTRFLDTILVEVNAYYEPGKSYVKPGKETNYLLNHEQRHFDIAEVYARKTRKEISQVKYFSGYKDSAVYIYRKFHNEYRQCQFDYDLATSHSLNEQIQKQWDIKIDSLLNNYSAFANRIIICPKK